ncbi:DUF6366 family protein [Fictibacillus macauensis]|nr:DUF6366 family protein [Fictibacillus macauensis]
MHSKETPAEQRERLKQEELKNNPIGSLNEGLKRVEHGNLVDVVGGIGWIGMAILILVVVIGYVLYRLIDLYV